jgi:zinc protease
MIPRLILWLAALTVSSSLIAAEPVASPGFTPIKSLAGIDEYRLDSNGLQVLLKPDHSAPVVTLNVTFKVGSRNEVTGTTGATHILEHLMFKGSEHFNDPAGNSVKQFLERVGGSYNATTSTDRTHYYATIGKAHLAGYLAIEADRMRNLWLHAGDLASEMTVVRNEYERGENSPSQALRKEVYATAFQAQPYHHSTIGWRSDIEKIRVDKLREFYDTFYWPNNATVTIVGDFEPAEALALIKKEYGVYPSSPKPIPEMTTEEPEQTGARRLVLKRPGQLGTVMIAFKGTSILQPDAPALDVLGSILSNGKNSRLYRALVDTGLATGAGGGIGQDRDPGLFMVSASLTPGTTHEKAEQALLAELDKVKQSGVTQEEITRVLRQQKVATVFGRDGSAAIASALNEWIAAGDWTMYETYEEALTKVTPADVLRVANKYLDGDRSTTGWFVPVLAVKK